MTQVVVCSSYRGGTGKSTVTANLAYVLASLQKKVVVIDTDIVSPGIHMLFGLSDIKKNYTNYIQNQATIYQCMYDVSETFNLAEEQLVIIPASTIYGDIAELLKTKQTEQKLQSAIKQLVKEDDIDFIIIDTHPGINAEMLVGAATADMIINIIRPDNQDFEGAQNTSKIFQKLDKKAAVLVNKTHSKVNRKKLRQSLEKHLKVPLIGFLPFSEDILFNESSGIFSYDLPNHEFTDSLIAIATKVFGITKKEHLAQLHDLLAAVKKNGKHAHILQNVQLADQIVDELLAEARDNEWISGKNATFKLTAKGKQVMHEYDVVQRMIQDFGF